ncbi:MAG: DUF4330 domain-containing protein [Candidatus Omnitrophica bacterium]|nr:DUF4330 domain-containing protein [Candidatus Omnitrophota bacterium]
MQFIDEKGRIFGKINIIDLMVLTAFLVVMPMAYVSYNITVKKPEQFVNLTNKTKLLVRIKFDGVPTEIADQVKEGDSNYTAPFGMKPSQLEPEPRRITAVVKKIVYRENVKTTAIEKTGPSSQMEKAVNVNECLGEKCVVIDLELSCDYDPVEGCYSYNGDKIKAGLNFSLFTSSYYLRGMILSFKPAAGE